MDFEHKLKVKKIAAQASLVMPVKRSAGFAGRPLNLLRQSIFTESLILAQDERWRRA
jgi:hypothetical protein